ncbi:MAG: S41 family peptidase [Blastocatellia bacterium]
MVFSNCSTGDFLKSLAALAIMISLISLGALESARAQSFSNSDRERFRAMLKHIKNDLQKNYYDPAFHGIDIEARFKDADKQMQEAPSLLRAVSIIGQFLLDFDDPTTFFVPPLLHRIHDFGFDMQIIGNECYIIAVKPGADAANKGLKVGDQVHNVILQSKQFPPTREDLWIIRLVPTLLMPLSSVKVEVQSPGGQKRLVEVIGKSIAGKSTLGIDEAQRLLEKSTPPSYQYDELSPDVFVWQIRYLAELTRRDIDDVMNKVMKRQALILDLRRATGAVLTKKFRGILGQGKPIDEISQLKFLAGYFFDQDIKVADLKGRGKSEPLEVKTRREGVFKGKLVMIVDSDTETIAEIFARMMQLEKRGSVSVIGDRTSGAARIPTGLRYNLTDDNRLSLIPYGASITSTDVIMSDGQSLDRKGVTPDKEVLPTAEDLAAGRDPALSHAAELVGVKITPQKAGAVFPAKRKFTVWLK